MECTHPEVTGAVFTHSCGYALFHLTCRLISKGKGKYCPRFHTLLKQMGYLVREHTCFSGTGTGNDHAVAIGIEDGISLAWIQFLLVIYHNQSFVNAKITKSGNYNYLRSVITKNELSTTVPLN